MAKVLEVFVIFPVTVNVPLTSALGKLTDEAICGTIKKTTTTKKALAASV